MKTAFVLFVMSCAALFGGISFFIPGFANAESVSGDNILTPSGTRQASDLRLGDGVIGFDSETGERITNVILKIELITPADYSESPFTYIVINGEYELFKDQSLFANNRVVHASEIKVGDVVQGSEGEDVLVTSIDEQFSDQNWVKLSVSGNHTYIADGLILHNASRYWVGGGSSANWTATGNTNWGSISNTRNNASVPGSSDDVIFNGVGFGASNSTLSANISINSLDMTGYANTLTHNAGIFLTITGNMFKLASGMTYTLGDLNSGISFTSTTGTSGAPTMITTNGKTLGTVGINGAAGYFQLQDNLVLNSLAPLNVSAGTFDANDFNVTAGLLQSNSVGTRTIDMGNGIWTIVRPSVTAVSASSGTFTMLPGLSTFVLAGTGQGISGDFTFHNLTKTVSSPDVLTITPDSTITVTGTLTLQGAANNLLLIRPVNDYTVGTFSDNTTGSGPQSVINADMDKDGDLDLVVGNSTAGSISIFINDGAGNFATKVDYTGVGPNRAIASGDVNKDTFPDVVVFWSGGFAQVMLNNGDGTLAASVDYACGGNCLGGAVVDINNDGWPDMMGANWSQSTMSVFINNGDGTFGTNTDYAVGTNPRKIAPADFNNDGFLDVVVSSDSQSSVAVLLNNGNGTFATKVHYSTNANSAAYNRGVDVGDLDLDGNMDILIATQASLGVLMGNGDGTFDAEVGYYNEFQSEDVRAADMNDDGFLDAIITSSSGSYVGTRIFLNYGNGTFYYYIHYLIGTSPQMATAGDFNNDGRADFAAVAESSNRLRVILTSNANTNWYIDPQGERDLSYLSIKDAVNINAAPIETAGLNISNGGSNTGWDFSVPTAPVGNTTTVTPSSSPAPGSEVARFSQLSPEESPAAILARIQAATDKNTAPQPEIPAADPIRTPSRPSTIIAPQINMQKGNKSSQVKALQMALNALGFKIADKGTGSPGSETDLFGPATEKAVQKFQLKFGIVKSAKDSGYGVFGPKTRAKLNELIRKE